MRTIPRKLSFQLVSLFDLLMIVIFAQYLDVEQKSRAEVEAARREAADAERHRSDQADALAGELDRAKRENAALRAGIDKRAFDLTEELRRSRDDLARLGTLVAELFNLPDKSLEQVLNARPPAEAERLRAELKALAAKRGAEAVRHILALAELQKRCDVWEIHIGDDNAVALRVGDRTHRFRAETAEAFAARLFQVYKSLPQPKSLVVILLSWSNAGIESRNAAEDGLPLAVARMSADSDRRVRFEYAVLRYIPLGE